MNKEPGNCAATYLKLQGLAVVAVERVQHPQEVSANLLPVASAEVASAFLLSRARSSTRAASAWNSACRTRMSFQLGSPWRGPV